MVLREGFGLAIVGTTLGVVATLAGAVAASGLLFGVKPVDPLSYVCSAAVVVAMAMLRLPCAGAACEPGRSRRGPGKRIE